MSRYADLKELNSRAAHANGPSATPTRGRNDAQRLDVPLDEYGASPCDADVAEVVIVAAGGSGKATLSRIIRQTGGKLPEGAHAIAMDTDPDPVGLPLDMMVPLPLPQSDYIVARRQCFPGIDHLLTSGFTAGKVYQGSMMKRMVTAAIVIPYQRRLIRKALWDRIVKPFLKRNTPGKRTRVVVMFVGSMGGGFGSGARDGIIMLLRDLFRRAHRDIDVHVECHAFTPDVHYDVLQLDWQKSRANANAFAWIMETEAAFADPSILHWRDLDLEPFDCPIVNGVRVYSAINENGKMLEADSVYEMTATCIVTEMKAAIANPKTAHIVNMNLSKNQAPYGGSAAWCFSYPAEAIQRHVGFAALVRLLTPASGRRLNVSDDERIALQLFSTAKMNGVAGHIQSALPVFAAPPMPQHKNERQAFSELTRQKIRQMDGQWRRLVERAATEASDSLREEMIESVRRQFREMIAKPGRQTPHDVRKSHELLLIHIDERIAAMQGELSSVEPARLMIELESAVIDFERRRSGLFRQTVGVAAAVIERFKAYSTARLRQASLRGAVEALDGTRPTIISLIAQANAAADAILSAIPKLQRLANGELETIGVIQQPFVVEAIDEPWVRDTTERILNGIDWIAKCDDLLGPHLAEIDGRRSLQSVLESSVTGVVLEMLSPDLSCYHAFSSELPLTAAQWLLNVWDRIACQFAFFEPNCNDDETYYSMMLAAGTEADGKQLMECAPHAFRPEIVATGDPNRIVVFAQRQFVPMEAAFPNLDQLVADYRGWRELAQRQPQAVVESTRRFAEMEWSRFLPFEFAKNFTPDRDSVKTTEDARHE